MKALAQQVQAAESLRGQMAELSQTQAEELVQVTSKIAESAAGVEERVGERFELVGDQVSELVNANRDGAELVTKQLGKVVDDQAAQNLELIGAIRTAHESAQQANMATTGQVQQLTMSISMMLEDRIRRIKKTCLGRDVGVEDGAGEGEEPTHEFALPFAFDFSLSPYPNWRLDDEEGHRRTRWPTVFLRGCGSMVVAEWFTGAGAWASRIQPRLRKL